MNDYYVFDGQNTTTGTPNRITGNMSFYGRFLKFHTKKEAVEYVENYRGYDICKIGTRKTLRKYDLGSSVFNYNNDLDQMDYSYVD